MKADHREQLLRRLRILVVTVDDNVEALCRDIISAHDYELIIVNSGEKADQLVSVKNVAVAVVSARLPDMTGMQLIRRLKRRAPDLEAIFVADQSVHEKSAKTLQIGFSGCVEQPLDPTTLMQAITHITRRNKLREEHVKLRTLVPIYELGEKFIRATSETEVFHELLEAIRTELRVDRVTIMRPDQHTRCLKIVASIGVPANTIAAVSVKPGERVSGWVYQKAQPVILNKRTQDNTPFAPLLERDDISAAICFPMLDKDGVIGVINISQTKEGAEYTTAELELVSVLSRLAVIALQNVRLIREREETVRVRTLFEQYVSPEVAGLLIDIDDDLLGIGAIRELTVMFADIRHFTLLVQRLPLAELRQFLNGLFNLFTTVVYENRGTLDKFMGDAALVVFGAPVAVERPSHAAVVTAAKILSGFEKTRSIWQQTHDFFSEISLGIGIGRGEMFIGNVGSSSRLDYTVIGADVNIAQRLASENNTNHIFVTESVYRDIGASFPVLGVEEKKLRGFTEPTRVYTIQPSSKH